MGKDQSVAEHSYNVVLIARVLALSGCSMQDVQLVTSYALVHDADEWYTGDIPSPFKRDLRAKCPEVTPHLDGELDVPDHVRAIVKLADCLEAIHFAREFGGSRVMRDEIFDDIHLNFDRNLVKYESVLPNTVIEMAVILRGEL
jgi:hypothetical protein